MHVLTRSCKTFVLARSRKSILRDFSRTNTRPIIFKKGKKIAANSHKTQDILPRSIKSIFQLIVWLIKIILVWQDREKCLDWKEQGWPKSYSRFLTLPQPRSFLVTIKCRTNGNGHGQSNAYITIKLKVKITVEVTDFNGNSS